MLRRVGDVHGYGTRAAGSGLFLSTRDHCSVGYRVPVEWASLSEEQRGAVSLASFKGGSRRGFLDSYAAFVCVDEECDVCGGSA